MTTHARMRVERALVVAAADVCVDGPHEPGSRPRDARHPHRGDQPAALSHLVRDGGWRLCGGRAMRDPRLADDEVPTCPACRAIAERAAEALREARP
jgi:hypothetical protein